MQTASPHRALVDAGIWFRCLTVGYPLNTDLLDGVILAMPNNTSIIEPSSATASIREATVPGPRITGGTATAALAVLAFLVIPLLHQSVALGGVLALPLMAGIVWVVVTRTRRWWAECHLGLLAALGLGLLVPSSFVAGVAGDFSGGYAASLLFLAMVLAAASGLAMIGLRLFDRFARVSPQTMARASTVAGASVLGLLMTFPLILVGTALVALIVAWVLVPAIVAYKRGSVHALPILVLSLLFGWTVVGWVAAFIWAFVSPTVAGNTQHASPSTTEGGSGHHRQVGSSALDDLARLAELKSAGVLSDEEFDTKKQDLLSRV